MSNGICDLFLAIERKVAQMSMSRKDSKGEIIKERRKSRKNDGRYAHQYTDSTGKGAGSFIQNDLLELREKEKRTCSQSVGRLESYCSGKTTLNYATTGIFQRI